MTEYNVRISPSYILNGCVLSLFDTKTNKKLSNLRHIFDNVINFKNNPKNNKKIEEKIEDIIEDLVNAERQRLNGIFDKEIKKKA